MFHLTKPSSSSNERTWFWRITLGLHFIRTWWKPKFLVLHLFFPNRTTNGTNLFTLTWYSRIRFNIQVNLCRSHNKSINNPNIAFIYVPIRKYTDKYDEKPYTLFTEKKTTNYVNHNNTLISTTAEFEVRCKGTNCENMYELRTITRVCTTSFFDKNNSGISLGACIITNLSKSLINTSTTRINL